MKFKKEIPAKPNSCSPGNYKHDYKKISRNQNASLVD